MRHKLSWLSRIGDALYRYHYGVGLQTVRLMRRTGRAIARITAAPRRWARYVWVRRVVWPAHRFGRGMGHLWAAFIGLFCGGTPFGVRWRRLFTGCREEWHSLGRLLGPAVGAAALAVTLVTWTNTDFCLNLTYQGHDLGVVENAAVYDEGALLARNRVNNVDDSFTVDNVPVFTMQIKGNKAALTDGEVCDAILSTAGDSIAEATGLYVDGDFIAAMESGEELTALLDSLKEGHFDPDDPDQRAEFVQTVATEEGLYPISAVYDAAQLRARLTAQTVVERTYTVQPGDVLGTIAVKHDMTTSELRAMNPAYANTDMIKAGEVLVVQRPQSMLQVKAIKTIRYTETIDYTTKTVYRDDKYVTYSKVTTKGVEGSQNVTAEITYIDGIEESRTVIKKEVTKQPVTKVVEVGTKKVVSSSGSVVTQGDGVTTGRMTWPVPICHSISQGYTRSHYAIDIANGPVKVNGKPAVAADGGTVIQASTGWNGGYGNVVKIQHSNGLITVYAHLQSIKVVKGQQVTRGQTIGLVGNTGRSFGPHLHFEVIKNGVKVNPLNYVKP